MSTFGSLKLAISASAVFFEYSRFGAASPVNSLSWISPFELEHSFLAMAVMYYLCMYTCYGRECKNTCACIQTMGCKELNALVALHHSPLTCNT